jgi:hypothetical protein
MSSIEYRLHHREIKPSLGLFLASLQVAFLLLEERLQAIYPKLPGGKIIAAEFSGQGSNGELFQVF